MRSSLLPYHDMPLSFAVADFHLRARRRIVFDKFPGFTVRSGFGAALKKLCLFKAKQIPCRDCYLNDRCPYSYIFETPKQDPSLDFTAENFPHPFVFYPRFADRRTLEPDEPFTLTVTLFGKGIDYLMYYIYAFDLLGEMGLGRDRSGFVLEAVRDGFSGALLYRESDKTLRGAPAKRRLGESAVPLGETATLHFITPTKVCENNRTVRVMTAELLIRSLLRRGSLLARLHEKAAWPLDFRAAVDRFAAEARVTSSQLAVHRYERYSSRQGHEHPLFAFTGSVTLSGVPADYAPLLAAGVHMHLGNGTSQGFGRYELQTG